MNALARPRRPRGSPPLSARRLAPLSLALLVGLIGGGPSRPSPAVAAPTDAVASEYEDGAIAPAHGWTQDDGCPARTGASAAKPLHGALERAWKWTAKEGRVEGEPLAWKDRVFVVESGPKRRLLRVLVAATGAERTVVAFDAGPPLRPSVGEGRALVRTSATLVEGIAIGDAVAQRRWKITAREGIGVPTMLRDEVYVVRDGVLERWAYGTSAPVWPKSVDAAGVVRVAGSAAAAAGASKFPRPSLRGPSVFVVSGKELVEVDRATGAEKNRVPFEPDVDADASSLVVGSRDVFLRLGNAGPRAAESFRFVREPGAISASSALSLPTGLASVGASWIALVDEGGKKSLCALRPGGTDGDAYSLASGGSHAEFVTASPPTYASGALYVGLRAFGIPSLSVFRAPATTTVSRAVPLRDRLLVVENAGTVSSWREVRPADDKPVVLPTAAGSAPAAGGSGAPGASGSSGSKGSSGSAASPPLATSPVALKGCRAALDDGRVLEGPFTFDPAACILKSSKPGELPSCPGRSVSAVITCDAPRRLLLASRAQDAAAGVAAIAQAEAAKAMLALVSQAIAAGDAELARRVLSTAIERGVPDAEVAGVEAKVVELEASGKARDEAKATEVETALAALGKKEVDALLEVAGSLRPDIPREVGVALVRAVADRDPTNEAAGKWVRERLPKGMPVPEPLQLGEWLEFIEVRAKLAVRVWGMAKDNEHVWGSDANKPSTDSHLFQQFWSTRSAWPGDAEMVAFQCGPLCVFAPMERPGAITRCLALGRLVSDTLDKVYSPIATPRTDAENLIVHFYSSRDDYLRRSRPTGEMGEAERKDGLENTAGHYSPGENVTRMFFPADDDAFSVPGVYAHELTHHWIERRRPYPEGVKAGDAGSRSSTIPGYWVVEGFADFVRGFVFDVAAQKANPENPRADYVDCVAGIAPDAVIPWPKLLSLTQAEFQGLPMENPVEFQRRWKLGPPGQTVPKVLFYDQGAAVCGYLYLAENGKHKKALLDFVYAYYEGKVQPDTLSKSTGLSSEELGKRVVAWCKDLVKKG